MNLKVTDYIENSPKWNNELAVLRSIFNKLELEETYKWRFPVYTYKGKNVVGIAGFKNYFGIWFFQGSLLKDDAKVLYNAQKGKTQAMLQWRMSSDAEININLIKQYVLESMQNVDLGKQIKPKRNTKPVEIPDELLSSLKENTKLKSAFDSFSVSKQREFSNYIQEAKREATKLSRIEKITPLILRGEGLHDKYKNC